jgi:hypothetical protein
MLNLVCRQLPRDFLARATHDWRAARLVLDVLNRTCGASSVRSYLGMRRLENEAVCKFDNQSLSLAR